MLSYHQGVYNYILLFITNDNSILYSHRTYFAINSNIINDRYNNIQQGLLVINWVNYNGLDWDLLPSAHVYGNQNLCKHPKHANTSSKILVKKLLTFLGSCTFMLKRFHIISVYFFENCKRLKHIPYLSTGMFIYYIYFMPLGLTSPK